jgi:outer membrane protein TolC
MLGRLAALILVAVLLGMDGAWAQKSPGRKGPSTPLKRPATVAAQPVGTAPEPVVAAAPAPAAEPATQPAVEPATVVEATPLAAPVSTEPQTKPAGGDTGPPGAPSGTPPVEQGAVEPTVEEEVREDVTSQQTNPVNDPRLTYEQSLVDANERTIADEISVDLIDVDTLRGAIEGQTGGEQLRLSLAECVQIALRENPQILVDRFEPLKADGDILAARGEFDPALQTTAQYNRSSVSADQQIQQFGGFTSVESYRTTVNSAIAGKLHYGTQYSLALNMQKEESTYGGFIEEFSGNLALTLTQPLLRGFGRDANLVRVRAAENARKVGVAQLRLTVMTSVADVIRAYWDLVGAIENVRVQEGGLRNAERLMETSATREEIGTAAELEVLQAKAGVATRQSEVIAARSRVADAGDRLKQLLGMRDGVMFSRAQIIPIDRPNMEDITVFDPSNFETSLDTSIARALEHRPELEMSEIEIANAELDILQARNNNLPQFDLTGTYGRGGRDHKLRETLYGIREAQDKFYTYGFQASIPFRNRAGRGTLLRGEQTQKQAEQRREQTRQNLMLNVQLAARNVATNRVLVESNRQARRMQEVNVVAEEKRLRLGVTTSYQVLQVQEDLTAAQTQEVQAQIAYEQSLVDLQLAEGMLLENLGVTFEAPDAAEPVGYWRSLTPQWAGQLVPRWAE